MGKKRKIEEQQNKEPSVEHLIYRVDPRPTFLPGWPGYRNAGGRSGLGYLNASRTSTYERAHASLVVYRKIYNA